MVQGYMNEYSFSKAHLLLEKLNVYFFTKQKLKIETASFQICNNTCRDIKSFSKTI